MTDRKISLMGEYIEKRLSAIGLEEELLSLIARYNKKRKTFLLVYASAIGKRMPEVSLCQEDFYIISNLLRGREESSKLDIYLETPGGSGEAAEEIVRFTRAHFDNISFVISGEAKSAGTLMTMSGDEILMTETGSLGPLDAQIKIGRTTISAFDYMEWIKNKHNEAEKKKSMNPFDAIMVAQISPGELELVDHSLNFAKDLVVKWLGKYKFKNWDKTKTQKKPVTDEMKKKRAKAIANELINHAKWRSHGRSLKIRDLEDIGLRITEIDNNLELSDIVYRIQTVCMLLFKTTTTYKIFATQREKIFAQALGARAPIQMQQENNASLSVVNIEVKCEKCGKVHKLYAKLDQNSQIDKDCQKKGQKPFPKDNKLKCECGFEIDLSGMRNEIEIKSGKKVLN